MELKCTSGPNGRTMEEYKYSNADFKIPGITWQKRREYADNQDFLSAFDKALRCKWAEKMEQGLFRYPLWSLQTRILPGRVKYVAQLNIKRGIERRKPQDIRSIQEKFNPSQFNFSKIRSEETLFEMVRSPPGKAAENEDACLQNNHVVPDRFVDSRLKKGWHSRTLVVINVSPLEFGHVLFIPEPTLCLNQILIPDLALFGMESILLSGHPGFRVGFNSLGGFASVNHLHLHGFYLDEELLIESASCKPLCPKTNFYLLTDFPAPGFLFYTDGEDLVSLSQRVCRVTDYLVDRNIAHNIFLTRGCDPGNTGCPESREGIRVVIWARKSCFGSKEESAFNVALCELAGHLPFKNQEDFINMSEESVIAIIKEYLFSDEEFRILCMELAEHLTS
ncbi:PREDICTED: GDP-D-glucose phosphorylase 1 [Nanorana parkeri]|uniref:GDP-D-glucose phosphorylase 1 n=1 Tax=Nanorana parkeri TaxID=125878 RepID=UPI000854960B|nr:PREDICTED: GDP-D-glucose phosphorylase 1 [Nanorana parkeri]